MLSAAVHDPAALAAATQAAELDALAAGGAFGAALRAAPEFAALVATNAARGADPAARAAIDAYNEKQEEHRVEAAMNLLSEEQAQDLGRLLEAVYAVPSVVAYVDASVAFEAVGRETATVISGLIGIDFAANSRSGGCCG